MTNISMPLKNCIKVIAFLAILIALQPCLNFLVDNISYENPWSRILWHNYREDKDSIDNIYVGSSHVYCGVDPEIMDSLTGEKNFNLATEVQKLNDAYYLIKQASEDNNLKHVYLEVGFENTCNQTYSLTSLDPITDSSKYLASFVCLNNMPHTLTRAEYAYSINGLNNFAEAMIPLIQYKDNFLDIERIKENIKGKSTEEYKNYQAVNNHYNNTDAISEIRPQGYFYCNYTFQDKEMNYTKEKVLEENPLSQQSLVYLDKIVKLCKEKNIELTVFSMPTTMNLLVSTENYDNFYNQMFSLCQDYGIDYYNFNLTKSDYLSVWENNYFMDDQHMNCYGAEEFTPLLYEVTHDNDGHTAAYFYDSFAEKLADEEPAVYGIYHQTIDEEYAFNYRRIYYVGANRTSGIEYQIEVTNDAGEYVVDQAFSESNTFMIPADGQHYTIHLVARLTDQPDKIIKDMYIEYAGD